MTSPETKGLRGLGAKDALTLAGAAGDLAPNPQSIHQPPYCLPGLRKVARSRPSHTLGLRPETWVQRLTEDSCWAMLFRVQPNPLSFHTGSN